MEQIIKLKVVFAHDGVEGTLYPTLLVGKKELILVDAGYPGFLPLLEKAITDAGFDLNEVKKLVLTSHELDHIGAVEEILAKYPQIEVWTSEGERRFLEGEKISRRLGQLVAATGKSVDTLDEPFASLAKLIQSIPQIRPAHVFKPREYIHTAGGIEFLELHNQTMLYLDLDQTLVAGDTFSVGPDNTLVMDSLHYSFSPGGAVALLQHLKQYEIKRVLCYHGGEFTGDVAEALASLNDKLANQGFTEVTDVEEVTGTNLEDLGANQVIVNQFDIKS